MTSPYKKILFSLLLAALPVFAAELPVRPQGPVGDYAGILDAGTKDAVSRIGQLLWDQAGFALVVATVPSIGEESIEEYAVLLYEKWGVGAKGKDEGALVLLSLNPRRVRIEVGYGAEGYLNDAKTGRLLDAYGVPYFKTSDYGRGVLALSMEIARAVASEKQISLTLPANRYGRQRQEELPKVSPFKVVFFLLLFLLLVSTRFGRTLLFWMIMSSLMGGGRHGGFGGGLGGGGFGGGFGGGISGGGGSSRSF